MSTSLPNHKNNSSSLKKKQIKINRDQGPRRDVSKVRKTKTEGEYLSSNFKLVGQLWNC
jgi:hypothetical protein